jgi:hypothetical protein
MSTLKEIIQRALGGEESKVASYEASDDYVYDYADDYTEKLASSLEYLALNLHAIELPVEQKVAEFQEFLTKMAEDPAVAQGAMEDAIDDTVIPNDYGVDITGGEVAPRPVAQSRVVLPMNTPIGAVHDMSATSILVDDEAPGIIPVDEQAKVAGVLRVFELLKMASAVDNPPNIVGERVEDPGLLLHSPDGLGTPAGGPFAIPEIQSNESVIQASGRELVRRNNAGILNYISESGEDPTEDLLLDNAKHAFLLEAGLGHMGGNHGIEESGLRADQREAAHGRMGLGAAGYGILGGMGGGVLGALPGALAGSIGGATLGGLAGGAAGAYMAGKSRGRYHAQTVRDDVKTASLAKIMGVL